MDVVWRQMLTDRSSEDAGGFVHFCPRQMRMVELHFVFITLNFIIMSHQLEIELAVLQKSPKIMFVFGMIQSK